MMKLRKTLAVAALSGVVAAGCVDLAVLNPNDADTERALRTASDVEALVASGWGTWWASASQNNGVAGILSTVSYQHSATAANFGMVNHSSWPKIPTHSSSTEVYYNEFANPWIWHGRAISSVVTGLKTVNEGSVELTPANLARLRAYGYYVLGLAHGSNAIMYDRAWIYDPSMDLDDALLTVHPYGEVMEAALGYFDLAIQEIEAARAASIAFTIPATWMSRTVTRDELERHAYSMKARYRAAVARNPAERAAVDWAAVVADANRGVSADWTVAVQSGTGFTSSLMVNIPRYGPWGQLSYQVLGMADQSGQYQRWLARDPWDRHPFLGEDRTSDPFLIITPDSRFPQGSTIAEQEQNAGTIFEIPIAPTSGGYGAQWNSPARGSFRWSFYRSREHNMWLLTAANRTAGHPEITVAELRGLRAEGLYRMGDLAGAAALVNVTREAAGLNATNAAGLNTSCVPKLPSGACGDLWEMLKWEVRLNSMHKGLHLSAWYFHHRGWGDLAEGVFVSLPIPGDQAFMLDIPAYTFGGPGGDGSTGVGTYGY